MTTFGKETKDQDEDLMSDISEESCDNLQTPLIIEGRTSTSTSASYKDLVFQFPSISPRSILKSSNNNCITKKTPNENKIPSFLAVPPSSSLSKFNSGLKALPSPIFGASTPLPMSFVGKSALKVSFYGDHEAG